MPKEGSKGLQLPLQLEVGATCAPASVTAEAASGLSWFLKPCLFSCELGDVLAPMKSGQAFGTCGCSGISHLPSPYQLTAGV